MRTRLARFARPLACCLIAATLLVVSFPVPAAAADAPPDASVPAENRPDGEGNEPAAATESSGARPTSAPNSTSASDGAARGDAETGAEDAAKPAILRIFDTFRRGGPLMWAILAASVVGLAFVLERLVGLRQRAHIPPKLLGQVEEAYRKDGPAAARELVSGRDAALARVLDGLPSRGGATRQELERALQDDAARAPVDIRPTLRPVGIVASVTPLLGLLGTVLGMITAFQAAAEKGMDNPAHFAEGIYEALYTTAFGLTVAIPFLILYHYLRGKADVILREAEDQALRFIVETAPKE